MFALDFDAKKEKLWTGKSHTYSPFAYYHLYRDEDRAAMIAEKHPNGTALSELGRKDNEYRVIVELMRFYLEYAAIDNATFTGKEWKYIQSAKEKQSMIEHVTPVGINPDDEEYIQYIWCLRGKQIKYLRKSGLGTRFEGIESKVQKEEFLKLLDILEDAVMETEAVNSALCHEIRSKRE